MKLFNKFDSEEQAAVTLTINDLQISDCWTSWCATGRTRGPESRVSTLMLEDYKYPWMKKKSDNFQFHEERAHA